MNQSDPVSGELLGQMSVRVGAGSGVVIRRGGVVAVIAADAELDDDDVVRVLADLGAGGTTWGVLGTVAAVAAVVRRIDGGVPSTVVVVAGAATCTTVRDGVPGESLTAVDDGRVVSLDGGVETIVLALDGVVGGADPRSDLLGGVVPGGLVEVVLAADPPTGASPAALPPPVPGTAQPGEPRLNLLDEPLGADELMEPLPVPSDEPGSDGGPESSTDGESDDVVMVRGLGCSVGHVNRLDAPYCSACGRRLQGTVNLIEGRRPSLGTLIFDDGTAYGLDAGYVIGRDPSVADEVADGRSRPLTVADPGRSISRAHAEIRLDGWDTVLVDRGSANGTLVAPPGATEWIRLEPNRPVTLAAGSTVAVGRRTFVFQQR